MLRPQQGHVEFPQLGAGKAVIGLENIAATEFHRSFHPGIITLNTQNTVFMVELIEASDFGIFLEQGSDGTLNEGLALEFSF